MNESRSSAWAEVIALSEQMHQHAVAEEWELMQELVERRQRTLEAFFSTPVSADDSVEVANGIDAVLAIDERLSKMILGSQNLLAGQMTLMQKGKKATDCYEKHR